MMFKAIKKDEKDRKQAIRNVKSDMLKVEVNSEDMNASLWHMVTMMSRA